MSTSRLVAGSEFAFYPRPRDPLLLERARTMNYDDGDVSMASFRDESFKMSVDHDTIDVVWHSTQQPAIQSILEESRHHQRRNSPPVWDPNQTPPMGGCFVAAPRSVFKDQSTTRTVSLLGPHTTEDILKVPARAHPGMGRVISSPDTHGLQHIPSFSAAPLGAIPADLRKIRPSQRRYLTQMEAQSASGITSGMSGDDRNSQAHVAGSIENLDNLRRMIQTVGKTWDKRDSSPVSPPDSKSTSPTDRPPSRARSVRTSGVGCSNSRQVVHSGEWQSHSHGSKATKPRLATTIKVLNTPSDVHNAPSSRLNEIKRLMLPPARPMQRSSSVDTTNVRFPSKGRPEQGDNQEFDIKTQPNRDEFDRNELQRQYSNALSPSLTMSSQSSHSAGARYKTPPSPTRTTFQAIQNIPSQPPLERKVGTTSQPAPSQFQPKKALGMRRTLSGNQFETKNTSSSQHPIPHQIKQSLPTIPSQGTSRLASPVFESPAPPNEVPVPTPTIILPPPGMRISTELASRTKSFKVPWAASGNNSPVENQRQPSSLQSSGSSMSPLTTTSVSSSSPFNAFGGSKTATTTAKAAFEGNEMDTSMLDALGSQNPDSSYSFDEIDTEELDRVLSQRGA